MIAERFVSFADSAAESYRCRAHLEGVTLAGVARYAVEDGAEGGRIVYTL